MLPGHCKRLRSALRPSWHSSQPKTFQSCQIRKHPCSALPLMSWVNVFKLAPGASKESLAILLHSKASSLSARKVDENTLCRCTNVMGVASLESAAGGIAPKSVFFRCNEGKAVSTTKPGGQSRSTGFAKQLGQARDQKAQESQEAIIL